MSARTPGELSQATTEVAAEPAARYFLGVFTVESWREFKRHGGQVMGFTDKKAAAAARLRPGDRILCYLSKVSAFIGVMEVAGPSYLDATPIWSDGLYPVRLPVRIEVELPLFNAVPIRSLAERLSFMRGREGGSGWTIYVRSSPRGWSSADGEAVRDELLSRQVVTEVENGRVVDSAPVTLKKSRLPRFKDTTRVGRIIQKTSDKLSSEPTTLIGSYDVALSFNKVTGYSVNVPIASTCQPTATCLKTCYFAAGAPSWMNALRHQKSVEATIRADPRAFAQRVALEYDRLGLNFLRWNGGGDLFPESIDAIHHLARMRPDVVLWVVTRIPALAAQIQHLPNVFIHFSLDRSSMARKRQFLKAGPKSRNFFFSYQAEPGESVPPSVADEVSVVFFHNYEPTWSGDILDRPEVCPLNRETSIVGVCERCRRCFDGSAVADALAKDLDFVSLSRG
jgi:hypothetical protein